MLVICSSRINQNFTPKQNQTQLKRLIFNDKQKCLTCPKSLRLINGKLVKFPKMQKRSDKYEHAENCVQEGKF